MESKRLEAFRDGILAYAKNKIEIIETDNAIVEVLYKDQHSDEKIYFAEIKGTTLCAHGDTAEDAIEDALLKGNIEVTEEEKEKYRSHDYLFSVREFRRLTGACRSGIDLWLKEKGLKSDVKMTLAQFKKAGGGQWAQKLEQAIK